MKSFFSLSLSVLSLVDKNTKKTNCLIENRGKIVVAFLSTTIVIEEDKERKQYSLEWKKFQGKNLIDKLTARFYHRSTVGYFVNCNT